MRHRNHTMFLGALIALLAVSIIALPALAADVYQKKATWQETMLAARAALAAQPIEKKPIELGPWYTTGALDAKAFDDVFFPEKGIDPTATGDDGKPLWHKNLGWPDGYTHNLPGSGGRQSTYLFRTITADKPTDLPAGFGSDDGMAAWLGGERLLSIDAPRGVSPGGDQAVLKLKAGENQLLLKIHNNSGGYGFYFSADQEEDNRLTALWQQIESDFPLRSAWMKKHLPNNQHLAWLVAGERTDLEEEMIANVLGEIGSEGNSMKGELDLLVKNDASPSDPQWLELYERICRFSHRVAELKQINVQALRLAVEDLERSYGDKYPGEKFVGQIDDQEQRIAQIELALAAGEKDMVRRVPEAVESFLRLRDEALLANPLLDFDRLLLVRRGAQSPSLGLPQNWQGNCALAKSGYDDQIAVLSPVRPGGKLSTLYKPETDTFVGDVDLDFDGDKMLFSMPGSYNRWQIWEIGSDGKGLRQVTAGLHEDVDNYDACYLPDGRIIFGSTRCFHGVPCVGGGNTVANLFIMDAQGENVRQLCFDQDHNWCPTVLNNGRLLYARWEYSDSPHYFTRLLFHMNPDGTSQMEYYGSNSVWPNSTFYARPIPDHPTKIVAVISGHHGVPRMGELVVFDPAEGRHEATGAVQRIPGHGQAVEPVISDQLVNGSWPKFLHPYPLSDKYFLVAAQPTPDSLWGIYLVDTFDNMTLILQQPGYAMFEPVPLRPTRRPPVIPDRIVPGSKDAMVFLSDIYSGPGLKDVPRGSVKKLRLYEFHFAYPRMGGHINIGIDGPWDARRILGTVPVEPDGSAAFRVPAGTPIAVQPLDEKGRAMQIMRSWFTAMPGEVVSCVGCHDHQNTTPPARMTAASRRGPSAIEPWYGPARGFGFLREVQPVLDRYCVGCHTPEKENRPVFTVEETTPFRNFTSSYVALHPYVRRPGPESDYHIQVPMEFHAGTSELIQMLEKGHHNVKLDAEAWDRLVTWIDLNVPDKGTWSEHRAVAGDLVQRRLEMRKLYANIDVVPEEILPTGTEPIEFVEPQEAPARPVQNLQCAGWPFDAAEAKRRQLAAAEPTAEPTAELDLADGLAIDLALIPPGRFIVGDDDGRPDEYPAAVVSIDRPFYMGVVEITNEQFAQFDALHDSAYISVLNKDQGNRGQAANGPNQPAIRVSWNRAMAFCEWLSKRTGRKVSLPTEAQWEYACRAGTATPMNWGEVDADFGKLANLADERVLNLCRGDSPKWIPSIATVNDGSIISDNVGKYEANAWGLKDMHGNVAEWTRTTYRPYPFDPKDGRDEPNAQGTKSVRGGSWYDRPTRARSAFRQNYEPWQAVYNVGFRVVVEVE